MKLHKLIITRSSRDNQRWDVQTENASLAAIDTRNMLAIVDNWRQRIFDTTKQQVPRLNHATDLHNQDS